MIGLTVDKDNSFFAFTSDDKSVERAIRQEDLVSLTIVEEAGLLTTGSLRLRDQDDVYSAILRRNTPITVAWGYKKAGANPLASAATGLEQFGQQVDRRGYRAYIQNPSGDGDDKGVKFYDASFTCLDFRGLNESQVYTGMTRGQVIQAVMAKLNLALVDVNFAGMNVKVPVDGERQDETAFRYLARKSREWHAVFRVGYTTTGQTAGVFLDAGLLASSAVMKQMAGGTLSLNYATGTPEGNVLKYRWQNNEGENGQGDNIRAALINGQIVYQRVTMDAETVTVWQLDPNKVNDALHKGDFATEAAVVESVMSAKTFNEVKYLFTPVVQETAPNGLGYVVDVHTFGTPFATPPMVATFQSGFPPCLTNNTLGAGSNQRKNVFYLSKSTHSIAREGYFCDLQIVDSYVFLGAVGLQ